MHTDYRDREKTEKIPVKVHEWSRYIDNGDWWDISDFYAILEEGRDKVRRDDRFKDRPVYIFFMTDDDYEINLEFWGERMETDDEFDNRQEGLAMHKQAKKIQELAKLQAMALEHGYELVKKEGCF